MHHLFEVASGSVIGRDHARDGKNNQDSCYVFQDEIVTIALVGDGCSSSELSHVGSYIGLKIIGKTFRDQIGVVRYHDHLLQNIDVPKILENVRLSALADMRDLIINIGGNSKKNVLDAFLFTVSGCVISRFHTFFFSIGDGIIVINGEIMELGPFIDNAPPYFGYALLDPVKVKMDPESFHFVVNRIIETEKLETAILGCDGARDFIASEGKNIPGKLEKVGSIFQFVENDKYFSNEFALRRRLVMLNREVQHIDWEKREVSKEGGLLPDDTTIVALRRKKNLPVEVA